MFIPEWAVVLGAAVILGLLALVIWGVVLFLELLWGPLF